MSGNAEFDQHGRLVSTRYDDVYFSGDGTGQALHVFVDGNDLPRRFRTAQDTFVVAETGFGTGANFLIASQAFLQHAPQAARLVFVSTEHDLLDDATLRKAHQQLPEALQDLARELRSGLRHGQRTTFAQERIALHLLRGDATEQLARHTFEADAWFLDGFSPDCNPEMWSRDLLQQVAEHSASGCTFATYTVAGEVRRTLQDLGFLCERTPGFGQKRHMLRGRLPSDEQPAASPPRRVHVFGAGIAGACAARAFADRGAQVSVIDPNGIASGASGIPAAMVRPRLWIAGAGSVPDAEFVAHAFRFASRWFDAFAGSDSPFVRTGALICASDAQNEARLRRRTDNPATSDLAVWFDRERASELAGHTIPHGAAWIADAGVCDLGRLTRSLLDHANIETRPDTPGNEAHLNILATAGSQGMTQSVRGQAIAFAWPSTLPRARTSLCTSGYLGAVDRQGLAWLGSTYDRDDSGTDARESDDQRIHAHMAPFAPWAGRLPQQPTVERFVGIRQATRDRMPLIGPIRPESGFLADCDEAQPPTTATLGHGSRGTVTAPFAAALLVARAQREPLPLPKGLWQRLAPARRARTTP